MAHILIKDLTMQAFVGIREEEFRNPQTVVLSLKIFTDINLARQKDDIHYTLNYVKVIEEIRLIVKRQHHKLLEYLGGDIISHLFASFDAIQHIELKVIKPKVVPDTKEVGVLISQDRSSYEAQ
ncbi:uncharacterized protein TRIADDRAFT_52657 [Trichoplax adhaerens]|uniref:dihydroneopterin aldolase n=1 Tax=Trichoplax adhaerens TaxID=10228 RepID=B3RJK2_TRIAD|nr:hypothetical protein TRIADDRAFT_52657 [Trichoplax adhaerens]EDV29113.1 hypothetical protein TRIADDRAFT_52657 [Trichoplax adhaerens]|eukprot:XP_002108315.1 hypothetical protein TRIADDRAFT_52657 [Trichoplax adhaerens]